MNFKQILRNLRKKRDDPVAVGTKIKCNRSINTRLGKSGKWASYEVLCEIAEIFNVTVGQLLGMEEY